VPVSLPENEAGSGWLPVTVMVNSPGGGQSAPYTINVGVGGNIFVKDIDHIKYHIDWR
jgi:hypothetical protein